MSDVKQQIRPLVLAPDKNPEAIESQKGECLYRLNVTSGTRNKAVITPVNGNREVVYALPSGDNIEVGSYHDKNTNKVFFAIYNSNRKHLVLAYDPTTEVITEVMRNQYFDFGVNAFMDMCVVAGRFLIITDNYQPQRCIDLFRTPLYEKDLKWAAYSDHTEPVTLTGYDSSNNALFTVSINYTLYPSLSGWAVWDFVLNNPGSPTSQFIEFEDCGDVGEITATNSQINHIVATTVNGRARVLPTNHYGNLPLDEQVIDFIKWPPHAIPGTQIKHDPDFKGESLITEQVNQFRIRYVYSDDQFSTWGPWTDAVSTDINSETQANYVEIDFSETNSIGFSPFSSDLFLSTLKYVEIGVRSADIGDGIPGQLYRVARLTPREFALDQSYRFYNNEAKIPQSDLEDNKYSDSVPLISGRISEADNRVVFSDNTEGYNAPCIDAEVSVEYRDRTDKVWKIEGHIDVVYWDNGTMAWVTGQPFDDPGQDKTLLDGFTVYLAGTNFFATTNEDGDFEINGVPPGDYVLRIASHHCTYDDKHNLGDSYIIGAPSLKYQNTSTYVIAVDTGALPASILDARDFNYETVLNLGPSGGTQTLADSYIYAKSYPGGVGTLFNNGIYCLDEDLDRIELIGNADSNVIPTAVYNKNDHNGFGWPLPSTVNWRRVESSVGSTRFLRFGSTGWATVDEIDAGTISPTRTNPKQTLIYYNPSTVDGTGSPATSMDEIRTKINGSVVDDAGTPVEGVRVVLSRGRVAITDSNGNFEMKVYGDPFDYTGANPSNTRTDDLIWVPINDSFQILDYINPSVESITLEPFGPTPDYNYTTDTFTAASQIISTDSLRNPLKSGGEWLIGIVYADRGNRTSVGVWTEDTRLKLPFITESISDYFPAITSISGQSPGEFTAKLTINNKPPIWADHAYVVMTKNLRQTAYLQFNAADVRYADNVDVDGSGTEVINDVSFSSAELIYIDIGNALKIYRDHNADSNLEWGIDSGDRIRLIRDENGGLYPDYIDVPVKGRWGNYVVIENFDRALEVKPGSQWEIYRPSNLGTTRAMYEVGYIDIINKYTSLRRHELSVINIPGVAYRRYRLMFSEVHDNIGVKTPHLMLHESSSVSDFYNSDTNGYGRITIGGEVGDDQNIGQVHRPSSIRWGGRFVQGTKSNFISSFNAGDIKEEGREHGRITATAVFDNTLLVVQERSCHTRLINKTLSYQGQEAQELRTDNFIDIPNYLSGGYGCRDPRSFSRTGNMAYWFDINNACVAMYAKQAGVRNISGFDERYDVSMYNEQFFQNKARLYNVGNDTVDRIRRIVGQAVSDSDEYLILFDELDIDVNKQYFGTGFGPNIGEHDYQFAGNHKIQSSLDGYYVPADDAFAYIRTPDYRGWHGFYSIQARDFVDFIYGWASFKDGKLYIHDDANNPATFFGVQYPHKVAVVFNEQPAIQKFMSNIKLETDGEWEILEEDPAWIAAHELEDPVARQETWLSKANFMRMDRAQHAAFWMNVNSPNVTNPLFNGEPMKGEFMVIPLHCDNGKFRWLRSIYVDGRSVPRM